MVEIPVESSAWLWAVLVIVLLLIGGAVFTWFLLRRRNQPNQIAVSEAALKRLDAARQDFIEAESTEPLAKALSAIIRDYLRARFLIEAPKQTTEEFFEHLQNFPQAQLEPYRDQLTAFLQNCDRSKFARGQMDQPARDQLFASARTFVLATRAPLTESRIEEEAA